MNKIATSHIEIFVGEDQVINIKTLPAAKIGLDEASDALTIANNFSNGGGKLILIDIRERKTITRAARTLFEKNDIPPKQTAKAILINSGIICVVKNLLKPKDPKYPVKIFASEVEAIRWLYSFH